MVDVGCDSHSRLLSYGKQCPCGIARVVSSCVVVTYSAEYKLQIVSNLSSLASEIIVHRVKVFSSESPRSRHLTSLTMTHDKFNLSGRIGPPECSLIAWFMEPKWGPSGADRTQVGPMLAPWTTLSEKPSIWQHWWGVVVLYMSFKGCGYTAGLANWSITVLFSHIHSREVSFTRCLSQRTSYEVYFLPLCCFRDSWYKGPQEPCLVSDWSDTINNIVLYVIWNKKPVN